MTAKFPLLVQLVYHPGSTDAEAMAEYLYSTLNDEPAIAGLRIPTFFLPDDGSSAPPEVEIPGEADRVVVVLLADDYLAANARRATTNGRIWADSIVGTSDLCEASKANRFMPVQLSQHGWPIDPRLDGLNVLRAWAAESIEEGRKLVARRLVDLLIRCLRPHQDGEDGPPLTVFLSHTKLDLEREPRVVKSLVAHLVANQPEKTWFDSGDISTGSRFAKEIEQGVADAALLAVVTDSYASRSWCRREVLLAKRHQRPVVVVNAIQDRELRSFPYVGNVPVIRWNGQAQDAVDLLLRETLRHVYSEEILKQRRRPGDDILPAGPELVTLVHRDKSKMVLYPDPPLGSEELAVLEATDIRVETPLERYALENNLKANSLVVALSVSKAEDLARFGLHPVHLDSIFLELSRYLLLVGVRLAYGGHLKPSGYTQRLADLLHDPIVDYLRTKVPGVTGPVPELISYVAWPTPVTIHEEARLGFRVEVRRCEKPADVDEQLDPKFLTLPVEDVPIDSPARRYAWARGLTEMRRRQTSETHARIVVGGKMGPGGDGYMGRMPGVLEEALISIQAKHPVFLVGAFGGCARMVADALEGIPRSELAWDYQRRVGYSEEVRQLYKERGKTWDEYDGIIALLAQTGMSGLNNGLTIDENRELATTRSGERIIELVLSGLGRLSLNKSSQSGG